MRVGCLGPLNVKRLWSMKQTQGLIVTCLENRNLSFLDLEARNLENTSALVHRLEDYGSEFPCHWLLSAAASDSSQCQLVLKVPRPVSVCSCSRLAAGLARQ